MHILQLCYKPPFPPCDGGTLAMNSVTQGLIDAGHKVKILSVCSKKHTSPTLQDHADYIAKTDFESVFIDLDIHPIDAAIALLCGESYNVKRFYSKDFEKKIIDILHNHHFDVIHFESIFMAPYLPIVQKLSNATTILRTHNVEHRIWHQMAMTTSNPLRRWYLKKLALALRVYELEHINNFDGVVCITANDAESFQSDGCRKPIIDIPFGINVSSEDSQPFSFFQTQQLSLYHIGAMDWLPNQEGLLWFLNEVWPTLHRQLPQVSLHLAGRKMPDHLLQLKLDGVFVYGEVKDAAAFMRSKHINIVPLLSGSGIRVKIIEAMSLGKTVVTTTTGAAGINYSDGVDILIADTPQQFIDQIKRCADNPNLMHHIGLNARKRIETNYDIEKLTQRLIDFYNKLQKKPL